MKLQKRERWPRRISSILLLLSLQICQLFTHSEFWINLFILRRSQNNANNLIWFRIQTTPKFWFLFFFFDVKFPSLGGILLLLCVQIFVRELQMRSWLQSRGWIFDFYLILVLIPATMAREWQSNPRALSEKKKMPNKHDRANFRVISSVCLPPSSLATLLCSTCRFDEISTGNFNKNHFVSHCRSRTRAVGKYFHHCGRFLLSCWEQCHDSLQIKSHKKFKTYESKSINFKTSDKKAFCNAK